MHLHFRSSTRNGFEFFLSKHGEWSRVRKVLLWIRSKNVYITIKSTEKASCLICFCFCCFSSPFFWWKNASYLFPTSSKLQYERDISTSLRIFFGKLFNLTLCHQNYGMKEWSLIRLSTSACTERTVQAICLKSNAYKCSFNNCICQCFFSRKVVKFNKIDFSLNESATCNVFGFGEEEIVLGKYRSSSFFIMNWYFLDIHIRILSWRTPILTTDFFNMIKPYL